MLVGLVLLVCVIGLAWLFHSQRNRHRRRRDELKRRQESSRDWYESTSAPRTTERGAQDADPR
jgi:hypothetical protein